MVRVLQVYPQLNNAGTEMVIMNLYKNIDRTKVQFDFLVQKQGELDEIVKSMGARIYYIPKDKDYKKRIKEFFLKHSEYKIIHTHTHKEMGLILKIAKKMGVSYRIAHSHNYRGDAPRFMKYYKILSGWDIEQCATHFLACSGEAAGWLFPRKCKQAVVWNNAISLNEFLFNEDIRLEYRSMLGIPEDAKVVCHVGRFAEQKNHKKIIDILNILTAKDNKVYGILVGVGPLLEKIKEMSESERILFLGNRTDVPKILNAADVFLFPSLYEGLGIVAVEAQASGLMCIASNNVPKAADIGIGLFEQHDVNALDSIWIKAIEQRIERNNLKERIKCSELALSTDYNIKKVSKFAEDFYLEIK